MALMNDQCVWSAVPVETLDLPSFCAPILSPDDAKMATFIDFWNVHRSGDPAVDFARGREHAEEAIFHAGKIGQASFVDCVTMWIALNVKWGWIQFGFIEQGFFSRIMEERGFFA